MPEFNEMLPFKTIDETIDEITEIINAGYLPLTTFLEIGVDYLYDDTYHYQKITYRNSVAPINEFQQNNNGIYTMPILGNRRYWLKVNRITEKILNPGFRNLINIQKELLLIKNVTSANPFDFFSLNQAQYEEHKSWIAGINASEQRKLLLESLQDEINEIEGSEYDEKGDYDFSVNLNLGYEPGYDVNWGMGE